MPSCMLDKVFGISSSCQKVRTLFWLSLQALSFPSTKINNHTTFVSTHMSPDVINICSCSRWAASGFVLIRVSRSLCFLKCCLNYLHFLVKFLFHIFQSFVTTPNSASVYKCALCKIVNIGSSQSYPWTLVQGRVGTQFLRDLCCCCPGWLKQGFCS